MDSERSKHTTHWGLVGALALVVVGLAGSITFWLLASSASANATNRDDALVQAKARVPILLSYKYASLKQDLAQSEAQTVGGFHTDYTTLVNDLIEQTASAKKISTTATVTGAGVVSAQGSQVKVLVFLTQVTSAPGATSSRNTSRVVVTMQQTGGTWKIAGLQPE